MNVEVKGVDELIVKLQNMADESKIQQQLGIACALVERSAKMKAPKDTGALIESGNLNTKVGSGQIEYRTPYARRWYYMPANFSEAPERGNYWFERMKQQHKEQILAGAKKVAGGSK